jgi:hypothetical protein
MPASTFESDSQRRAEMAAELASPARWGYRRHEPASAEPAALACLALVAYGYPELARRPADWLAQIQAADGSVGISATQPLPTWPTALAMLAWNAVQIDDSPTAAHTTLRPSLQRATRWCLQHAGKTGPQRRQIGHDTTLAGWPWAAGTHSWLEPTCLGVLALKATGLHDHPRTREGVRLLVDRLLPDGGANYGNTLVLGQALLPHVQPTGLAMSALAGEDTHDPRIEKSLAYLARSLAPEMGASSLAHAVLGLDAWHRRPVDADSLVRLKLHHPVVAESPYKQALLLLAAHRTFGRTRWLSQPATHQLLGATPHGAQASR